VFWASHSHPGRTIPISHQRCLANSNRSRSPRNGRRLQHNPSHSEEAIQGDGRRIDSLPETVSQVLTRALSNLLPGDKTWAAQKCTAWDPDTETVETTPLTPKAKPNAAGAGTSPQEPEAKLAAPLHPGFPQSGQFPTKQEYQAATEEAALRNAANRATAQNIRDAEINRVRPRSYKEAAQQPATTQASLQQQLILEVSKRQALQADHEQRLKQVEADVKLLRQALTPARSAPLESVRQPVRDIKPPLNQTRPAVSNLGDDPSGGASGSAAPAPESIPNRPRLGTGRARAKCCLLNVQVPMA
jgi:hypothetical protein